MVEGLRIFTRAPSEYQIQRGICAVGKVMLLNYSQNHSPFVKVKHAAHHFLLTLLVFFLYSLPGTILQEGRSLTLPPCPLRGIFFLLTAHIWEGKCVFFFPGKVFFTSFKSKHSLRSTLHSPSPFPLQLPSLNSPVGTQMI